MRGTLSEPGKRRMHEIEHLPSFPANLSCARGQWKNAPGPFQPIRTHWHTRIHVHGSVTGGTIWGLRVGSARETSFRPKHAEAVWLFMKSSNVLAILPWIYPAMDARSVLSIRKSIERGLYTVNGWGGRNKFKYRCRLFDMLTRIVEGRPTDGPGERNSLIAIFSSSSFLFLTASSPLGRSYFVTFPFLSLSFSLFLSLSVASNPFPPRFPFPSQFPLLLLILCSWIVTTRSPGTNGTES